MRTAAEPLSASVDVSYYIAITWAPGVLLSSPVQMSWYEVPRYKDTSDEAVSSYIWAYVSCYLYGDASDESF